MTEDIKEIRADLWDIGVMIERLKKRTEAQAKRIAELEAVIRESEPLTIEDLVDLVKTDTP